MHVTHRVCSARLLLDLGVIMLHNKPQQDLKNTVIDPKYIKICALGNGTTENTPRDVSPETNSTDNNIYPILSNSSPAYSLAYAKPSGQESPPWPESS